MENENENPHPSEWLSPDKPIGSREEDILDRRGFSEALARAIREWSGRESLVLALYGAWGNGKSSIKNMVIECLHSESPEVLTVDFNPWQLANRPTLSVAFFDELGVAVGKGDLGSNNRRRAVLAKIRRWARRLQGGRDLVRGTRLLVAFVVVFGGNGARHRMDSFASYHDCFGEHATSVRTCGGCLEIRKRGRHATGGRDGGRIKKYE